MPDKETISRTMSDPSIQKRTRLDRICNLIVDKYEQRSRERSGVRRQDRPRASGIDKCARKMALDIKNWKDKPAFEPWVQQRVDRGTHLEERIVVPILQEMGFKWIGGQYACEVEGRNGEIICTGHIDGIIEDDDGERFVCDVKSMHPMIFQSTHTVRDLLQNRFAYKYPWQLLIYMWAHALEGGLFLIDDCLGHWKALPIYLWDYADACEEALSRCEEVVDHLQAGTLPDFYDNPSHCRDCWAFKAGVCQPPMDFSGEGMQPIESQELLELLERHEALDDEGSEYNQVEARIKDHMKAREDGVFLCGDFILSRKTSHVKWYDVPAEVKEEYETQRPRTLIKWTKVKPSEGASDE